MTDKQTDPLFLADQCEAMAAIWANEVETRLQAAALLRTQHAAIERKDALLRQCLKHVASNISMTSDGTEAEDLYDAIQQELSKQ